MSSSVKKLKWEAQSVTELVDATMDQTQPAPVTQSEKQCLCTFSQRMVGDGCYVCNPELAAELESEAQQLDIEDQIGGGA